MSAFIKLYYEHVSYKTFATVSLRGPFKSHENQSIEFTKNYQCLLKMVYY